MPNYREAYPYSYLSDIAIHHFDRYSLEDGFISSFGTGVLKTGTALRYPVISCPSQDSAKEEGKMRWILACFKFILFSHSSRRLAIRI